MSPSGVQAYLSGGALCQLPAGGGTIAFHGEVVLPEWRQRLVTHFAERGEPFLKNGRLQPRPDRLLYSPHFPKTSG
jgi:hypothetical protein